MVSPQPTLIVAGIVSLLRNTRKTERGAGQFLVRLAERGAGQFLVRLAVRAAPFALLRNTRKTERGAGQFLVRLAVRAAPFALLLIQSATRFFVNAPPQAYHLLVRTWCV
jgi:hypothetical protein